MSCVLKNINFGENKVSNRNANIKKWSNSTTKKGFESVGSSKQIKSNRSMDVGDKFSVDRTREISAEDVRNYAKKDLFQEKDLQITTQKRPPLRINNSAKESQKLDARTSSSSNAKATTNPDARIPTNPKVTGRNSNDDMFQSILVWSATNYDIEKPALNTNIVKKIALHQKKQNSKPESKADKSKHDRTFVWKDRPKSENSKWKELTLISKNFGISPRLMEQLFSGGLEIKSVQNMKTVVANHLIQQPLVISSLIRIADEPELSSSVFASAVRCIYQILVTSHLFDEDGVFNVVDYIKPSNFANLLNCLTTVPKRFSQNGKFSKSLSEDLYAMLIKIINTSCKCAHFEYQIRRLSEDKIRFMYFLLQQQLSSEMVMDLLDIFKIICCKRRNCGLLSCKDFYDSLHSSYILTQKLIPVICILQLMANNNSCLKCLGSQEKMINLFLKLISHRTKPIYGRHIVVNILNKIADNEKGLAIFAKLENYSRLYNYFANCKEKEEYHCRIGVYSILMRCQNTEILENTKPKVNLRLPSNVMQHIKKENLDTKAEDDSDTDSNGSLECYDSDDDSWKDQELLKHIHNSSALQKMEKYFSEFFTVSSSKNNRLPKFRIFSTKLNNPAINKHVIRPPHQSGLAFPDALMLAPESDQHVVEMPQLPLKELFQKLYLPSNTKFNFIPKVVFDLEELHKKSVKTIIPQPNTYMSSNSINHFHSESLAFESRFECGNLRKAIQIDKCEYNLLLSPDTWTTRGQHWFYFQISGMSSEEEYVFNIINFIENYKVHNDGMLPIIFSVKEYSLHKIGWQRAGSKVVFHGDRYINADNIQYKTLTFRMTFPHTCDYVYIANHYPYTYSRLMCLLAPCIDFKSPSTYVRLDKLCNTVNGANEVSVLTITAVSDHPNSLHIPIQQRPVIFITARVHPGETNASWVMEGILQDLLTDIDGSAALAREYFVFKIIPMLNIEGVMIGNNRRGITGENLNKCWIKPSNILHPEIYYTKQLIEYAKYESRIQIRCYMDIHGHSSKNPFFFLGCNPRLSWNSKDHHKFWVNTLELIPQAIYNLNPHIDLSLCRYNITKDREGTGRVVMWRQMGINHSYTLECSMSEGFNKQSISTKVLTQFGESIVRALANLTEELPKRNLKPFKFGSGF